MKTTLLIAFLIITSLIVSCGQTPPKAPSTQQAEIVLDTPSPLQALIETANSERRMCRADKECVLDNPCNLKTKTCQNTGERCQKNLDCEIKGVCKLRVCRF